MPGDRRDENVQIWIGKCLSGIDVVSCAARCIKNGSEREVWDCSYAIGESQSEAILSIFKPGSLETVNTNLPPGQAAQKCALAMMELAELGIPTPQFLGHAENGDQAAVLCEKIEETKWHMETRIQAAHVLARIHRLAKDQLSAELSELTRASDPREYRTTGGLAPEPESRTLVHGDYFSKNILATPDGICIIDWETFGWGDPMWDLGFLIGADRGLSADEVEAVIEAYESGAPVERESLMWHKQNWDVFWEERKGQAAQRNRDNE